MSRGNEVGHALFDKDSPSWRAISSIASDKTSGAAELLNRAVQVYGMLALELRSAEQTSVGNSTQLLEDASVALINAQSAMAPLARLANAALEAATRAASPKDSAECAAAAARTFASNAANAAEAASGHAARLIGRSPRILTHSRSSTVLKAFRLASETGTRIQVLVTESGPLMEGRVLAEELSSLGFRVTLVVDAAIARGLEQADTVLLGADQVTPSHLINKIGTRLIALAARETGKPVHSVCDTSKFINLPPEAFTVSTPPNSEIWPSASGEIAIMSPYFEETPLGLFAEIITEEGAQTPAIARQIAEKSGLCPALIGAIRRSKLAGTDKHPADPTQIRLSSLTGAKSPRE